jgi:hypothetical protein
MDLTPSSLSQKIRPWLPLATVVAVPLYGIPFGLFGLKAVYPRVLRDLIGGAIAVGAVSLVGLAVAGAKVKPAASAAPEKAEAGGGKPYAGPVGASTVKGSRWQLPVAEGMLDDGVAASAGSGH